VAGWGEARFRRPHVFLGKTSPKTRKWGFQALRPSIRQTAKIAVRGDYGYFTEDSQFLQLFYQIYDYLEE
jgi:hypothetical protein